MKILFICRGNVGRSQVATELYNQKHPNQASSAGTIVDVPGQKLSERSGATNAIIVMKELSIDMSDNITTQLTQNMLDNYDKVVVMAEPENIPEYLSKSSKFEYWDVLDMRGQDLSITRKLRDQIKELIVQRLD
ncbi:hypothetical protein H0W80_02045 [Candidatus Saccharibacteria bacterium]|nr:hypothetical protein [Candidatus Saccharibacteria bacterium]